MDDLAEFSDEYRDLVDDILRADFRSYSLRLSDFLRFVDTSPASQAAVAALQMRTDFQAWYNEGLATQGGMVGSGRLAWAEDRTERLAQTLSLVRHLAAREMEFANFASAFLWAGSNFNDTVSKINEQIVEPFARDLLKHIERFHRGRAHVPASDRVVAVDHNSAPVSELMTKLEEIEARMPQINSLALEPDYERNLAEIAAARRLLKAPSVRPSVLGALLGPSLKWLGSTTAGTVLSVAITAVIAILAAYFGLSIPGL